MTHSYDINSRIIYEATNYHIVTVIYTGIAVLILKESQLNVAEIRFQVLSLCSKLHVIVSLSMDCPFRVYFIPNFQTLKNADRKSLKYCISTIRWHVFLSNSSPWRYTMQSSIFQGNVADNNNLFRQL